MLALCALANTSWAGVLMQAVPHARGDEPMPKTAKKPVADRSPHTWG